MTRAHRAARAGEPADGEVDPATAGAISPTADTAGDAAVGGAVAEDLVTDPATGTPTGESRLALVRRARRMDRALAVAHPDAHCELDFTTPLQLLVATVLSAQTTDVTVNRVTPTLFARYPDAESLAGADQTELEEILRPTGFFRAKANSVQKLGVALVERFDGEVPGRLKDLVTLPGVGRKTANVVLGNAFGVPGITVDTHFGRLARRFGWTSSEDPVVVEQQVGELIPRKDWTMLSHRLIFHGRRVCHAKKPACAACSIRRDCPSAGTGEQDPARAAALVKGPAPEVDHLLALVGLDR